MVKNYIKVILRVIRAHPARSLINISGLATGFVCCMLIFLFVHNELRYDRFFEKANRMYRVVLDARVAGETLHGPVTAAPMSQTLLATFPTIEASSRLNHTGSDWMVRYEDQFFNESKLFFADSTFFEVFTIPFITGNPETALKEPNSVVITESTARTFSFFSTVAVIIACLGLFGLAAFMAEQRTKEKGIRKVLGAPVLNLLLLLTRHYFFLVLIAFFVAAPVSYLVMVRWLDQFAYRIDISLYIFLVAGGTALLIALGTVGYQCITVAVRNPIHSLRYE